jgi:hypothetical protein
MLPEIYVVFLKMTNFALGISDKMHYFYNRCIDLTVRDFFQTNTHF